MFKFSLCAYIAYNLVKLLFDQFTHVYYAVYLNKYIFMEQNRMFGVNIFISKNVIHLRSAPGSFEGILTQSSYKSHNSFFTIKFKVCGQ